MQPFLNTNNKSNICATVLYTYPQIEIIFVIDLNQDNKDELIKKIDEWCVVLKTQNILTAIMDQVPGSYDVSYL